MVDLRLDLSLDLRLDIINERASGHLARAKRIINRL